MSYWLGRSRAWLLYLFLFLLPFQTRLILRPGELNGYWEYGTLSIYAVEILLWFIVGLALIEALVQRWQYLFASHPERSEGSHTFFEKHGIPRPTQAGLGMTWWAGVLLVIGLVSAFLALSPALSFYWLLHFFEGFAIFLVIRYSSVDWRKLSAAFIAGAVLQAGLAIWQFATQSVVASKWLGMAVQDSSILGTAVVEAASGRFLRAYGSLPHPNILGAYLLIAIVLLFYCLIAFRNTGVPAKAGRYLALARTPAKFYILHFTFYILTIGIFFSFSRAAWLGLFLTIVFIVYITRKSCAKLYDRTVLRNFYILPISVVVIFVVLGLTFWPLVQTRLIGSERLEAKSSIERISGYSEAWQIIKNHPWLGVGLGNYTLAVYQIDQQRSDLCARQRSDLCLPRPGWSYQPVHNVYLLALAELGIVGFAIFIAMIIFLLKKIIQKHCGKNSAVAEKLPRCFLSPMLLFILFFLFLFDHFFWSLPFGIWLFWSIIALSYKYKLSASISALQSA